MSAWRNKAIITGRNTGLEEFNHLVLQHQDEAFCLAYYMLGNETQAGQVVHSAVKQAYKNFKNKNLDFRILLLQLVSAGCLVENGSAPPTGSQSESLQDLLDSLPGRERLTLILIDMLGLSYAQAGPIIHQPPETIKSLLSHGRRKLSMV